MMAIKEQLRKLVEKLIIIQPIFGLLISNILKPSRFLYKMKQRRLVYSAPEKKLEVVYDAKGSMDFDRISESLLKYGAVVLQNFYDKSEIQDFIKKRGEFICYPDKNTNSAHGAALRINDELCKYWNDKRLISIYQKVLNQKVYARNYPRIQFVQPRSQSNGSVQNIGTASQFHLDHASLIQGSIFLSPVTEKSSRMQVLLGSHRWPAPAWNLGEKAQKALSEKFEMLDCIGDIGTVQIHLGDVFHRFFAVADTTRLWLQFEYSDGYNILFNPWTASESLREVSNVDTYNKITSDELFLGLYPKAPRKGYEIIETNIYPIKKEYI